MRTLVSGDGLCGSRTERRGAVEELDVVESSEDVTPQSFQSAGAVAPRPQQSADCPVGPVDERALDGDAERIGVGRARDQRLTSSAVDVGCLDTLRVTVAPVYPTFCTATHSHHAHAVYRQQSVNVDVVTLIFLRCRNTPIYLLKYFRKQTIIARLCVELELVAMNIRIPRRR